MSNSPEKDDPGSGGFKSFWKSSSSSKAEKDADVTFVQQDPSGSSKKGGNRLSRIFKRGSTSTSGGDEGSSPNDSKSAAQKRRQQVYNAQKRHRNRKAEYVHNLEAEIAKLQQMDAQAHVEKNALAHQNKAMKELLASHSLDFKFDNMNLFQSGAGAGALSDDFSMLGSASIEVREDELLGGKERTFLDWSPEDEMQWSNTESANVSPPQDPLPEKKSPIKGDSWAAVDFILALEYPCQDHLPHHGINPAAKAMLMETEDSPGFTGHQLTMTSAVYESARSSSSSSAESGGTALQKSGGHQHGQGHEHAVESPTQQPQNQIPGQEEQKWLLPHTEIEKLVKMSSNLPIDDEEITPAQAYSAIRDSCPSEEMLKPCLDALKLPLSGIVECRGFGTVMPTDMFRQYLHTTLETLGLRGP